MSATSIRSIGWWAAARHVHPDAANAQPAQPHVSAWTTGHGGEKDGALQTMQWCRVMAVHGAYSRSHLTARCARCSRTPCSRCHPEREPRVLQRSRGHGISSGQAPVSGGWRDVRVLWSRLHHRHQAGVCVFMLWQRNPFLGARPPHPQLHYSSPPLYMSCTAARLAAPYDAGGFK